MVNEKRCELCTDKCPKAETLHETAKGRMYATKAFIDLQKKVESGQLVEVVRCKDCVNARALNMADRLENVHWEGYVWCIERQVGVMQQEYCSSGERRHE